MMLETSVLPHASEAKLVNKKKKTILQPTASNSLVASMLLVSGSGKQLLYSLNYNQIHVCSLLNS